MTNLQQTLENKSRFAIGVELLTTRGTMDEAKAVRTREFANDLATNERVDWVSITDNAGGNPQLAPAALGKPLLYSGKDVVIHLSCKDFNRNGLESEAWHLASEGFHNILTLSGDYPTAGYSGLAKPVFDIDSIGLMTLLSEMNRGLGVRPRAGNGPRSLQKTDFYLGAVVTNFKRHESEVVPQLLKLRKKVECGARFIISQIGFDARKSSELIAYMTQSGMAEVPLVGNVFLLNSSVAAFFHRGTIPGVVVTDELLQRCLAEKTSPDRGRKFYMELAAKQLAIFRGLGYRGAYIGGVERAADIGQLLEMADSFTAHDWQEFAKELQYPQQDEFFLYEQDAATSLADPAQLSKEYLQSLEARKPNHNVTLGYKFNRFVHQHVFSPDARAFSVGKRIYERAADPSQGPKLLRILETTTKGAMFDCRDCGDCSLPEMAYLCPESSCVKNQRNGPCGGTRDGFCEIEGFECIWSRVYDRLKSEGKEQQMLDHAPVIQDQSLRGTSSWGNTFRGIDHLANNPHHEQLKERDTHDQ